MQFMLLRKIACQGNSVRLDLNCRATQQSCKLARVRSQNENTFLAIETLDLTGKGVYPVCVQNHCQRRLFHQTPNERPSFGMPTQPRSDGQHVLLLEKGSHASIIECFGGNAA